MGHPVQLSQCPNNPKKAGRRVKWVEIWDSGGNSEAYIGYL